MSDRPASVYRLYDASEKLLYVGVSVAPFGRIKHHRHSRPWWFEVAIIRLQHFENLDAAVTAEKQAIATESPAYNQFVATPVPLEEVRREKEERQRLVRSQLMYEVFDVRCSNCGSTDPVWLKKGTALEESVCPRCKVGALEQDSIGGAA